MAEMWNLWEVKPPPVCTTKMVLYFKEVNCVKEILFDATQALGQLQFFHKEAAILSRLLYKNSRALHHEKGIKNLIKINQCLKRYLKLELGETINMLKQSIPAKLVQGASHAFLPTKQMFKWVLLRLQAFSQLFKRMINISKETGIYFYRKLHVGWSLNLSFLFFSITSRILVSAKYLLKKCIEWYNTLYKYLPYFISTTDFLPNYKFPSDLKKWLGDVDIDPPKTKTSFDEVFEVINITDENDDEDVQIVSESLIKHFFKSTEKNDSDDEVVEISKLEEPDRGVKRKASIFSEEDVGTPVSNDDVDDERATKKISKKRKKKGKANKN